MNGTPRRGPGGFPATPQTARTPGAQSPNATSTSTPSRPNVGMPLPAVPRPAHESSRNGPLIPSHILDVPTQRFYACAFWVGLLAWRLYDWYNLQMDDDESVFLCLKWCFMDAIFIFCLPLFEIPWLEWSNAAAFVLFLVHAVFDVMLMFRIGIPVQTWLLGTVAFFFDSELAISERSVKPGSILHNASLILGKQIIHILPEGSAILNPDKQSFCLNSTVTHLEIPILINQTDPIEIELIRIDIDTNQNETIVIKKGELRSMLKKARKSIKTVDPTTPLLLQHTVKKTGVYLLKRVLDYSKLEVRPRAASVVVASCPQARVKPTGNNRCRNELSNIALDIEGIAPLRIKYRTTVNGKQREVSEFQSLQPDEFVSPLSKHSSQALVHANRQDVSWARSLKVTVPLNETLLSSGVWTYAVEEVEDALGNVVNYVRSEDEDRPKQKIAGIHQVFIVHERPSVLLQGCTPQLPLQAAKGDTKRLPIKFGSSGDSPIDGAHIIEYLFTPSSNLADEGEQGADAEMKRQTLKSTREQPLISASGLYTIKSVSTEFCDGEVLEPASCLLQNPPEPELSVSSENIVDKCAGNPIGLRVGLDLIGTPPFTIRYSEQKKGQRTVPHATQIATLRSTIDLIPNKEGHYTYTFDSIKDSVYKDRPLYNIVLEQDVKPMASAHFLDGTAPKKACIDDTMEFDVKLEGEGPWKLEYELVYNGKRTKYAAEVEQEHYTIRTQKLKNGGEYTVSLASITDKMGCKVPLEENSEVKVNVRHERPKAYFGHIEGKQTVKALEGKAVQLPLRLTGENPWTLEYEILDSGDVKRTTVNSANDKLDIKSAGTYQLLSVRDAVCPGIIDENASRFGVAWIPRPKISVVESVGMIPQGGRYIKEAVCEGDEDSFDILLSGNPPYDVSYQRRLVDKRNGNTAAISTKDLRAAGGSASIRAETSQAGTYEYKFVQLSDNKYDHSSKHFSPLTIQQTVNPRPSARFNNPGKTYSYCSRESDGEEVIPMTFEGVPPFYLEVEIKHQGTPKPEISIHKNIPTLKYDLKIEHRKLHLGHSAISIRKIRDARGCTRKPQPGGPRVQISVHDAPTATPLEDRTDFCVGERLSFALGGQVPFTVYYTFEGQERKASNAGTTFRRLAELPGSFTITGLRDSASECLASLDLRKEIHPIPSVRLSGGLVSEIDIHEGGVSDLEFQFWGTPPFEFTYTRSTNAAKGKKSKVLEIKTEVAHDMSLKIPVQEEGTYEVVSIKDRWCSFAKPVEGVEGGNKAGQKLLKY